MNAEDPATAFILANPRGTPTWQVMILAQAIARFPKSIEALLAMANAQIQLGAYEEAEKHLVKVEAIDSYDWRVIWYRGLALVGQSDHAHALEAFETCYGEIPGELAPKLAIAITAEKIGDVTRAVTYYDTVSRTNPDYATAAFGLARCLARADRRDDAVAALGRIAQTSNLYISAQKGIASALLHGKPGISELGKAAATIEALLLEGIDKFRMVRDVLAAAIARLDSGIKEDATMTLLGHPFEQRHIRIGLESAYRNLAHLETDGARRRARRSRSKAASSARTAARRSMPRRSRTPIPRCDVARAAPDPPPSTVMASAPSAGRAGSRHRAITSSKSCRRRSRVSPTSARSTPRTRTSSRSRPDLAARSSASSAMACRCRSIRWMARSSPPKPSPRRSSTGSLPTPRLIQTSSSNER